MAFCLSTGTTLASLRGNRFSSPSASLPIHVGVRTGALQLRAKAVTSSAALLHCSFTPSPSFLSLSSRSSFSGLSLDFGLNSTRVNKKRALVVYASRFRLCQTKRNASRKKLAGVHGFRKRMSTTSGRAVLQRRRAKGRMVLCTKTNCYRGKRV